MLKLEHLTKYYKKNRGIDDVELEIKKGEIFGFIGPNGAGKTTTIRCIMNLLNKDKGNIYFDNAKINKKDYLYKEKIGYVSGETYLYEEFSVKEMFDYANSFHMKDCSKRIKELTKLLKIDVNKKIKELSLGNKKKVALVLALMHEPEFLILDEPTSGLDPIMQNVLYDIIENERKKGTTILFSTHNLNEVKRICDRVAIIKEGKIINVTSIKDMIKNNFLTITISGEEVSKIKLDGNIIIKDLSKKRVRFVYKGDINKIIQSISKIKIDNILIEEPSLEELFLHYYK